MLWNMEAIRGYALRATDDTIGAIDDLYFDDMGWVVRYVVVGTGSWLFGRKVLIAPSAFEQPDADRREFPVSLTKDKIKNSPDIDTAKPVNRQQEAELHKYYGWPHYWAPTAVMPEAPVMAEPEVPSEVARGDPHLRSAREVEGYHIHAQDGSIGHVSDFQVDVQDWKVRYLVVDTRNWLPGRKVLVSPDWVRRIDWAERMVNVALARDQVKESPEYEPGQRVDRTYEGRLYEHYGSPPYW